MFELSSERGRGTLPGMRIRRYIETLQRTWQLKEGWSSHRGSEETNLTSIHEGVGSIPGLAQWVKDPVLP